MKFLFFVPSPNTSSSHVPAHFLHPPARAASDPSEEALHWERNPDQRPPVPAAQQTELQVAGEQDRPSAAAGPR